jgi:2TM domain
MDNQTHLREVTKRVEAKLGFYVHFAAFLLVNASLAIVNLAVRPDHLWFQWPLIGWGAGLLLHAALVFGLTRTKSIKGWMIEREMKKRALPRP